MVSFIKRSLIDLGTGHPGAIMLGVNEIIMSVTHVGDGFAATAAAAAAAAEAAVKATAEAIGDNCCEYRTHTV